MEDGPPLLIVSADSEIRMPAWTTVWSYGNILILRWRGIWSYASGKQVGVPLPTSPPPPGQAAAVPIPACCHVDDEFLFLCFFIIFFTVFNMF